MYIELPNQDPLSSDYGMVGKLVKAMYGARDAPLIWQAELRRVMEKLGFEARVLQPGLYHNKARDTDVVAQVDDFWRTGRDQDLKWLHDKLKEEFDIHHRYASRTATCEGGEVLESHA